jgi:hypothetical protein
VDNRPSLYRRGVGKADNEPVTHEKKSFTFKLLNGFFHPGVGAEMFKEWPTG